MPACHHQNNVVVIKYLYKNISSYKPHKTGNSTSTLWIYSPSFPGQDNPLSDFFIRSLIKSRYSQ